MNVSKALLLDEDGRTIAIYEQINKYETSTSGTIRSVVSWECDTKEVIETEFFAYVNVKWDGCSHVYFYGEDYIDKETPDRDSYYHICGVPSYLQFMRLLIFAYEIMVKHVGNDTILEKEEYEELKELGLLNGYTIEYFE